MRIDTKEIEEAQEAKRAIEQETQKEATARIGAELRNKPLEEERKRYVKNYYLELTGLEMTDAEFMIYSKIFERAPKGWNIKSYIKSKGIPIKELTKAELVDDRVMNLVNNFEKKN